jgi:ABC-2 type transport system permease protein
MTVATPTSASRAAAAGPRPYRLGPALHYTAHSALLTAKNVSFLLFSVTLPVILYVVFSQMFATGNDGGGTDWAAMIMISMAAYGSLGAAMSGGAQLAVERRSGWFRQLALTVLPPQAFLWSKAAVIMLVVLPALLLVFAAGFAIGGVRAPLLVWLSSLGLLWLGLIPLTIFGIVIGLWVRAEAVQGLTTLLLLLLAMLGGLWFPVEVMPQLMQGIARTLPSYWLAELGRYPFLPDAAFPWPGVVVLLAWAVGLTFLGALGYRRAAANSKR